MDKTGTKPVNLKDVPKWTVRFEYKPIGSDSLPQQIERVLYDVKNFDVEHEVLPEKYHGPMKLLFLSSFFLRAKFRESKSPAEIIPPANRKLDAEKYYIAWTGFDPKDVLQWGIKTQEGDETYDLVTLLCKNKEGKKICLAGTADEPNLVNTVKHIKDLARFTINEPKKLKYVYLIRLQLKDK